MRLDVLHPPTHLTTNTSSDVNKNSVGLPLMHGRFSILLTGDVQWEAEELLLASGQPLDSLVLRVPHHGTATSLSLPFLEAIHPAVVIVSVGADNRFGHPDEVTLDKLKHNFIYGTDQQDTIEVGADGQSYWASTER